MATAAGMLAPVTKLELAGIPVGKAAAMTIGMGLGDVAKAFVHQMAGGRVPQWAIGLGVAWAVTNVKLFKNMLGAEVSELVALGVVADTIDDQVNLRKRTTDLLGGLLGKTIVSKSPPVVTNKGNGARPRSDLYAGIL